MFFLAFLSVSYFIFPKVPIELSGAFNFKNRVKDTIMLNGKTVVYKNISLESFRRLSVKVPKQLLQKSPVKKSKRITNISLTNGKHLYFKDVVNRETEDTTFTIEGLLANRFYALTARYYDTGETILVDKANGNITKLWGDAFISPDGKYLLSCSAYLDYEIMPTGIQFFAMENNKFKLMKELKLSDWEPISIIWIDNKSFLVTKIIPSYLSKTKRDTKSYLKFTFN
jgi:hypothetical protein